MSQPAAGWYADPARQASLRWWDGSRWTTQITGATPSTASPATPVRLAGWGERVRAYLLDAMPLWLVSLVLFDAWHQPFINELVGVLRVSYLTQGGQLPSLGMLWDYGLFEMWLVTALPGVGLRVVYDMVTLCWKGGTLGHLNGRLRVAPQNVCQQPGQWDAARGLAWPKALVRSLVHRLLAITGIGFLLCVLWPLVDPGRRSLADLAAGTQVVHVDVTTSLGS
ncbi:DUF2510 domain-containing protein [Luteococcus sp. Sow4_B9]|uniref:DUF2510 domain-containing protein n=1 Tax=Luteococcus sp. Sow4_B9 TaxID=3438792 RepID=UPI003F9C10F3